MNSDLELLLKLQVIDYDIGELERSKEYLPDMMGNLRKEIEEASTNLDSTATEYEQSRLRQKSLEIEVQSLEANLQKFQQQMMAIKTNKEYDALVSEIDNVKSTISNNETELLEIIDRIDELEKDSEDRKEKLLNVEENNKKQLAMLQEKVDSIGSTMETKMGNRKEISSSITRQTLTIYERVKKGKGGTVVVVVKKRACGACYKALTPRKVQEIKRADKINTCDNCGRLLFWENEESN